MAADRGPQGMNRFDGAADGGRKADTAVGPIDVVVHGLGDRVERHTLIVQVRGEGQGAVAADRHQCVEFEMLDHVEDMAGAIDRVVTQRGGIAAFQELRQFGGAHRGRVGARRMQHGAAGPVDGAHGLRRQRPQPTRGALRIAGIEVEQTGPARADSEHRPTAAMGGPGHRLDTGVQAGDVAAAGQYADLHGCP